MSTPLRALFVDDDADRLAAVVRSCPDAVIEMTPDGLVTGWNPAAERLFGWSAAEAIGRGIAFLVPDERSQEQAAALARVRGGEPVDRFETVRVRKDGARVEVAVAVAPVRDRGGRVVSAAEFASDVGEKKALQRRCWQAQRREALWQLAAGVTHDFNNLLTLISGCAELLLQRLPRGDAGRELAEDIHRAGERAAALTRQLLALSRQQAAAPKVLDLNAVVADAEKLLSRAVGEDVRLETSLRPRLGHVKADPGQLEQVLLNLAINARDAMPGGGG